MIVALAGYSRTGKDEVGKILIEKHGFVRLAKGDLIKEAAYNINPRLERDFTVKEAVDTFGWENAKDMFPELRSFLQNLPDQVCKVVGSDPWNEAIFRRMEPGANYVLTRICLPVEAEAVKAHGGVVWRIERPGYGPINDNPNEVALDGWSFDWTILNQGTLDDLSDAVSHCLDGLSI
jgi:hypothetical protein